MRTHLAQLRALPSVDAEYRFGRPRLYLTPRELARLTLLRSRLADTRAEREAQAAPSATRQPDREPFSRPHRPGRPRSPMAD